MSAPGNAVRVREADADDLVRWDSLVREFPNHRLGHTRAWLDSLDAAGFGSPLYLLFESDGAVVGCLPGLIRRVGPWRLFGSPLAGWQTVSMGPAFDPARLSTPAMLDALVPYLEDRQGVAHVELMLTGLEPDALRARGFRGEPVGTYRAALFPGDEERALTAMKDSARRNIRRASRLGLVVRFEDHDEFVDEHYDQVAAVYRRRGTAIPFSRERVLACFRRMREAGALIAASVYLPGGRVSIATGMFFIENRELLLWTWAHRDHYRWYRGTEAMTWAVMRRAMAAGCESFDLMGRGDFKAQLGAELDFSKWRWMRSRPRWLAAARRAAAVGFLAQQAVRGRVGRLAARVAAAPAARRRTPACVIGDGDLVRTLGLAGLTSALVAPPGSAARSSRFTRVALAWMDPRDRPVELVESLLAYGQAQPEPPVLYYQDDRGLLFVSRHRERLRQAFRFVIPDAGLVEQLTDPGRFVELAARLHLPVPRGRVLRPADQPVPTALDLAYPLVLEPLPGPSGRWRAAVGPAKAVDVQTPAALNSVWPRLAAAGLAVFAREGGTAPGGRETYHVYADEQGRTVAEFTGRVPSTANAPYGDATALEITDAPDVTRLGRDVVRRLRLRGVAQLDFVRGPAGDLQVVRVNPRFSRWHHAGARAGVNIPALVYGDLVGRPRPAVTAAPLELELASSRGGGGP